MRYVLATMLIIGIALPAHAARIRDLSLSPQESLKQHNSTYVPTPLGGNENSDWQPPPQPPDSPDKEKSRFMDIYCDPTFRPVAGNVRGNGVQSCLKDTQRQACDMFYKLPADAQAAVERSVSCANAAGEAEE
mgnify:CR=1 FL=1